MKKALYVFVFFFAFCLTVTSQAVAEEGHQLTTKVPMTLYGFVSAQSMWGDSQVGSFGVNLNMTAPNRVIDETTVAANNDFIGFTLQNTRVGLYLEPYDFGGKSFNIDARIELDFWSTAAAAYAVQTPRIRRAYTSIGTDTWNVLFGQEWDLFAPLNPLTINVGSVLWNQGNLGSRRPQIRLTTKYAYDQSGIELGASVNSPNNSMLFNDLGNTTGMPMFQGRLGYWREGDSGKYLAYLSGVYGRHDNVVVGGADVNNWGTAFSLDLPFSKLFRVLGEAHYGYSLNPLLSLSANTAKQRTYGGWGEINSTWCDWFETNVGYGSEMLNNAEVAATNLKTNMVGFGNMIFRPVKSFSLGFEYNYMRSNYQGSGNSIAHTVMSNVMYQF